jgi:hypothetical protein
MISRNLILAVKEMSERHWDIYTMAARLKIDPALVQQILDMLT